MVRAPLSFLLFWCFLFVAAVYIFVPDNSALRRQLLHVHLRLSGFASKSPLAVISVVVGVYTWVVAESSNPLPTTGLGFRTLLPLAEFFIVSRVLFGRLGCACRPGFETLLPLAEIFAVCRVLFGRLGSVFRPGFHTLLPLAEIFAV
jgi:hypothetical protein